MGEAVPGPGGGPGAGELILVYLPSPLTLQGLHAARYMARVLEAQGAPQVVLQTLRRLSNTTPLDVIYASVFEALECLVAYREYHSYVVESMTRLGVDQGHISTFLVQSRTDEVRAAIDLGMTWAQSVPTDLAIVR